MMTKLGFLFMLYTGSVLAAYTTEVPSRPKKLTEEDLKSLFGDVRAIRSQPATKDHVVQLLSRFLNSKSNDVSDAATNVKKERENELTGNSNADLGAQDTVEWMDWGLTKRQIPVHLKDAIYSPKTEVKKKGVSNEKREGSENHDLDWYTSLQSDFDNLMKSQEKRSGAASSFDVPSQRSTEQLETIAMFWPADTLMEGKRSWGAPPKLRQSKSGIYSNLQSSNVQNQRSAADQLETFAMFWPAKTLRENKRAWPILPKGLETESEGYIQSANNPNQRSVDQLETFAMFWPAEDLKENKRAWPILHNGLEAAESEGKIKSSNIQGERSADQFETIAMFWPADNLKENKRAWPILPKGLEADYENEGKIKSSNDESRRSADQLKTISVFWPAANLMESRRSLPIPNARHTDLESEVNFKKPKVQLQRSADNFKTISMFWPADSLMESKKSLTNSLNEQQVKSESERDLADIENAFNDWGFKWPVKAHSADFHTSSLRSEPMAVNLENWFNMDSNPISRASGQSEKRQPLMLRSNLVNNVISKPSQDVVWPQYHKRESKQAVYDALDQLTKIYKQTGYKRDNTILDTVNDTSDEGFNPKSTSMRRSVSSTRGRIGRIISMLESSKAKA